MIYNAILIPLHKIQVEIKIETARQGNSHGEKIKLSWDQMKCERLSIIKLTIHKHDKNAVTNTKDKNIESVEIICRRI